MHALSVVKFASGLRPGSYVSRESHEQARYARRLAHRSFVLREVLTGVLLMPFARRSPVLRFDEATLATPGGMVAELRRIRGLD